MEQRGSSSSSDYSIRKGLWTAEEDNILMDYIRLHGKGKWNRLAKVTGLKRCGKSCRLRWMNYLSPNIKRGDFSQDEDDLIIRLHSLLGNRWSLIAGRVPGRTDNQVKNHWNTHLSKSLKVKKANKTLPKPCFKQLKENSHSNSVPPSATLDSGELAVTKTRGSSQTLVEVTGAEEQRLNIESCESSFWVFSDDFLNFDTPNLMDIVGDDESLGFVWQDL